MLAYLRQAPLRRKLIRLRELARRAGPALPSYLALHHAGFSVPRLLPVMISGSASTNPETLRAVGSYPTFSPLPNGAALEDVAQVSLFDVTEHCSAGGLFSVALSVISSTGFSL